MSRSSPAGSKVPGSSVLDRLLLGSQTESEHRAKHAQRLREAVRRDLEALFNTRPLCRSWPYAMRELNRSILSYGLPDLQTRTVISSRNREALRAEIEAVIRSFEPRLQDVVVELTTSANALDRSLRFRIHGHLVLEAGGEAVVYDSQINSASLSLRISQAERDRGGDGGVDRT